MKKSCILPSAPWRKDRTQRLWSYRNFGVTAAPKQKAAVLDIAPGNAQFTAHGWFSGRSTPGSVASAIQMVGAMIQESSRRKEWTAEYYL